MSLPTINHATKAIARLPDQLSKATTIIAWLNAMCVPIQELETVLLQLLALKSINDAVGATLDLIGKIVGQDRLGLDDTTYRRYIKARIRTNKSRGLPTDYITIAQLILGGGVIEVRQVQPATVQVTVHGLTVDAATKAILLQFLSDARGAGVRLQLVTSAASDATTFSFRTASILTGNIIIGSTPIPIPTSDRIRLPATGFVKIDSEVRPYSSTGNTGFDDWTTMRITQASGQTFTSSHAIGAIVSICDAVGTELNNGRGYNQGFWASVSTSSD